MLGELRALIEWSGYSLVAFHRAFCDNGPGKKISAEPKTAPRPAPATATGNLLVANQRAVVLLLVRLFLLGGNSILSSVRGKYLHGGKIGVLEPAR